MTEDTVTDQHGMLDIAATERWRPQTLESLADA